MSLPSLPSDPLNTTASGAWLRQMLEGASALGLAERLAGEPQEVGDLAEACGADADALLRLLRVLASLGVLEERTPRRFAPTPMAALLRGDHPGGRPQFVRPLGEEQRQLWETGLRCLRHGEIGKGLNDYDAIFTELKRRGFAGWISIEDGVDGMDQLERSVAFLRHTIAAHWPGGGGRRS